MFGANQLPLSLMSNSILKTTKDGSHTLFDEKTGEYFHSVFGAVQESEHIFIRAGLQSFVPTNHTLQVLEIGLGTGLNALLTLRYAEKEKIFIHYVGVEAFPLSLSVVKKLNYPEILQISRQRFEQLHDVHAPSLIHPFFHIERVHTTFQEYAPLENRFQVVYFDAFSPGSQPEMWTEQGFKKLFNSLAPRGILVTYSCKGSVKRALKAAGFQIEKLPGPPGKREFLRAYAVK